MKQFIKNQKGMVIVEATFVLPVVILCVIALYYAAIFMCQKANLQTSLEVAAVYYKNTLTDQYVSVSDMNYSLADTDSYDAGAAVRQALEVKNPYSSIFSRFEEETFKQIFYDNCKFMFFASGEDIKFTSVKDTNYLVYREITVTAEQTLTPAVSFRFIGIDNNNVKITSSVKFVVNDTDEFIRNLDCGIDIIDKLTQGTEVRNALENAADAIGRFYNKYCK